MSSVPPPPGPPAPPAPIEPGQGKRGCGRNALIGCGAVCLIVVLGLIAFMIYVQRKPAAITDFMMKQIEANYAADVTEQEKTELRSAYAAFRTAVEEKRPRREPMERVRRILSFGPSRSEVTREQVRELTEAFRDAAGQGRPEAAREVTPMSPAEPAATPSP